MRKIHDSICVFVKYFFFSIIIYGYNDSYKDQFDEELFFSQFLLFIKKGEQFIYQNNIVETSCLCEICQNASLIMKAIKRKKDGHPTIVADIPATLQFSNASINAKSAQLSMS